jgi:hypothetical protein
LSFILLHTENTRNRILDAIWLGLLSILQWNLFLIFPAF